MAQAQYENILVETVEGGVGIITLNRPAVLNALSRVRGLSRMRHTGARISARALC